MKRLTNKQLADAAAYLNETGQLAELIAHMALQVNVDLAQEYVDEFKDEEDERQPADILADHAQSYAYECLFSADLENDVDSMIETLATHYL